MAQAATEDPEWSPRELTAGDNGRQRGQGSVGAPGSPRALQQARPWLLPCSFPRMGLTCQRKRSQQVQGHRYMVGTLGSHTF